MLRSVSLAVCLSACLYGTDVVADLQVLSADMQRDIANAPEQFAGWETDSAKREMLFMDAFYLAIKPEPIDNRPYLMALAVDLYNSLPPGQDPYGHNDWDIPGKGMARRQIVNRINYKGGSKEQTWSRHVSKNQAIGKEMDYIFEYVREHVKLDEFDKEGSIKPADINLAKPTHYAELKKWLDDTAQLREQGIPPWEAAQYLALAATSETQAVASTATPTPATAQLSEPAPRQAQPEQSEEQELSGDEATQPAAVPTSSTPWVAAAMVVFVLAAVGGFVLLRRHKNN